jgi:hypothetical protein
LRFPFSVIKLKLMKKYFLIIFLMLLDGGFAWNLQSITLADTPLAKDLAISELKVTGDEFVVLHNTTNTNLQLNDFWLQYFNDFDLSRTTSATSFQLPSVWLRPGQEIMLSSGTAAVCGPVWASKLSLTLKDSAGMLQVLNLDQAGGIVGYKPQDQVSWSSKIADSVDIKGVSGSADKQIYYLTDGGWQAADTPPGCTAASTSTSPSTDTPESLTQNSDSPPSILLSNADEAAVSSLPPSDAGLMAPQLSEILPNPASPKTDANDEYIELYNPNDQPFDLSNFKLQTASGSAYIFPEGRSELEPRGFKAYYSSTTNLTLPNSGSQIKLLDPSGSLLGISDSYSGAADDAAWVLADGLWQWTAVPTPDARNVTMSAGSDVLGDAVNAPPASSKKQSYASLAVSEILPNPKTPQTDAENEFIEIYNPSSHAVDLAGYTLVAGSQDNHKYSIKDGSIAAGAYKAFYSSQTHLMLSNSAGRVKILAPSGSQTDATADYTKAPDGQSWVFANDKWRWTTAPTPGKANIYTAPEAAASGSTAASRSGASVNNPAGQAAGAAKPASVHPLILAGIGGAVLLYAAYEYRHDVANQLYRLRRNRGLGRAARQTAKIPGGSGIAL